MASARKTKTYRSLLPDATDPERNPEEYMLHDHTGVDIATNHRHIASLPPPTGAPYSTVRILAREPPVYRRRGNQPPDRYLPDGQQPLTFFTCPPLKPPTAVLPRRDITNKINWVLDNLLPPLVRDSDALMRLLFFLVFRKQAKPFLEFKDRAPFLSQEEFLEYYEQVAEWFTKRPTDLNAGCLATILDIISGTSILDVGCGRGYLAQQMVQASPGVQVTGLDIFIAPDCLPQENLRFVTGSIEALPFSDRSFDTVVCTHTLEHIPDIEKAVSELRRVTRKRLLIVVPCQREYRYTFDLHVHFFPYEFSLQQIMKNPKAHISRIGGDFLYCEDAER